MIEPDPDHQRYVSVHVADNIAILTLCREQALNALSHDLIRQVADVVAAVQKRRRIQGERWRRSSFAEPAAPLWPARM